MPEEKRENETTIETPENKSAAEEKVLTETQESETEDRDKVLEAACEVIHAAILEKESRNIPILSLIHISEPTRRRGISGSGVWV